MKLYSFLSELFSSYFAFFVFSFNESFNAANICVQILMKAMCSAENV